MGEERSSQWGRIAADGTVYVRTAAGEREVGSWHAGTPEEGLGFYSRRYDDLAAEIRLLQGRLAADASNARSVMAAVTRMRDVLPQARVVGDLDALARQLSTLAANAGQLLEEQRAVRVEQRDAATAAKQTLVAEAERLAEGTDWKVSGDRLRAIAQEWRSIQGADRTAEAELWQRFTSARDAFGRRRGEHFAALDKQRKAAALRKEELIEAAQALAESTEWAKTAARYRELLVEWKAAGRAARDADDELWTRFRAAQDVFFGRRAAATAEKDAGLAQSQQAKEALLAEAEALDPGSDLAAAQRRFRDILDRWGKAGRVPRGAADRLEQRLETVQERMRHAADARWQSGRDVNASPLVIRLRESIGKLEARVARARERGDGAAAAEAESTLATQRGWLAQAERG